MRWHRFIGVGLAGLLVWAGCAAEEAAEQGPPEGWEAAEARWWKAGQDTSGVFRDLETFEAMQIAGDEVTLAANRQIAQQSGVARQQFEQAVKRSLIALFRNSPEVVDSLFRQYVSPKLQEASLSGDMEDLVDKYKREGYRLIARHYREPRTTKSLGTDIPVPYPDSLRARNVEGVVRTQVYINEAGEPVAVELLEGVHPALDDIGMRATTQMRWQPAYLLKGGRSRPIPSWARFNVRFSAPEAES